MPPIYCFDIFTVGRQHRAEFHANSEADLSAFSNLFWTVGDEQITMELVQRATPEMKDRVADFCTKRHAQAPQLSSFAKLICRLADGEAFVVIPARDWTSAQIAELEMLVGWSNGTLTEVEITEHRRLFGLLLTEYKVVVACTDRRTQVGNAQVERRTCRFCRRSRADGATFKKQAHAIPRALGNVHLTLADECDDCNEFFGDELEPHLLAFLSIQRVYLRIKGRGGNPRVTGRGGTMLNDGGMMVVAVPSDSVCDKDGVITIEVPGDLPIVPERCYRALAKFALSVLPEVDLSHLAPTINWVRSGVVPPAGRPLPPIQAALVPLPPDPSAQLTVYVRKAEQSPLPHVVCEFRLGCFVFVFHLPYSEWDANEPSFIGNSAFFDVFQHYGKVGAWRPYDFSSREPLDGPAVMRVMPQPNPKSTTSNMHAE